MESFVVISSLNDTGQGAAGRGVAGHGAAGQGMAGLGGARQGKAWQGMARKIIVTNPLRFRHKVKNMVETQQKIEWEQQKGGTMWPSKEVKAGESIEGKCISIDQGTYGLNYSIEQADKTVVITKAGKALLPRMVKVQVGTMVKIIFKGEEPPKKRGDNPMMVFEVFIGKPSQ